MTRDANLQLRTLTTNFVNGSAYSSVNGTPLNLGLSGLPLDPSMQGQVWCTDAAAVREITVLFEVSVDGGSSWKPLGEVIVPATKTGRFVGNIGRELKVPYGVTDVRIRDTVSAATSSSTENATLQIGLGIGEGSDGQQ